MPQLCQLGFDRDQAIKAYFSCDKNEELAADSLFEQPDDDIPFIEPLRWKAWALFWKGLFRKSSRKVQHAHERLYEPLKCDEKEIRVLEVEAGSTKEGIRARLKRVSLGTSPAYEALSYVWGSPKDQKAILVDGSPFHVTTNLATALHYLRYEDRPRTLWIDAICINQSDYDERQQQVQIMRDIYASATKVLAWLGEPSDDSDLAMKLVQKTELQKVQVKNSVEAIAFANLCSRPYWTRIWILQEISVNYRNCVFGCGHVWVEQEAFYTMFQHLHSDYQGPDDAEKMCKLAVHSKTHLMALFDLWQSTVLFCATDPRDKIYALRGLMNDADSVAIQPNYRISVEELQRCFAAYMIQSTKSLRAIEGNRLPQYRQAQSWLPLLDTNVVGVGESDLRGKFTFGGYSNISADGGYHRAEAEFLENKTLLKIKGFEFDTVDYSTAPFQHKEDILGEYLVNSTLLMELVTRAYSTIELETPGIKKDERYDPVLILRKCLSADFSDHQHIFEGEPLAGSKDYQYQILLGFKDIPEDFQPSALKKERLRSYCNPFLEEIFEVNRDRCFFITRRGYMGLGPADVKKSDSACILYGGCKPFILRPAGRGRWRLQGDAYVSGIMKGELFRTQYNDDGGYKKPEISDRRFVIC